ncbi:hypothetical protein [Spirosoma fluviale]|nr:hypothetical protein [Spirosoma fluviale]
MKQPTIHFVLLSVLLATFTQKALAQKTETSTPVNLTEFAVPPFPVEVVRLEVQAGQLSLLTRMPIAGRPLPISETPKPRGAIFDPSAVYVCQQTLNTQGQPTAPVSGKVFAQALPSASPADFAVFGTQAADGPMRLPLGGTPREMSRDYPKLTQTEPTIQKVWLVSSGQGQNFATYRLSPRFRVVTRETDPQSGQLRSRADVQAPQQAATEAKTGAYLAVAGSLPEESGRVIALSPTATNPGRYEGLATRFVEGDKNASARQVNLLTFAADGTLLRDQPVPFAYNRQLSMRIPVCDEAGHVVGSLSVFTDGPGKKDARDPQENRFSVVITDEQGGIWSQIELTAGGSSPRALVPIYALRQQNRLLLHSLNGQKLLKPVYESWAITRSGPDNQAQATLLSSMSESELYDRSKAEGSVNGGERIGWHFYNGTHPVDSFVGNDGSVWVLQQRLFEIWRLT